MTISYLINSGQYSFLFKLITALKLNQSIGQEYKRQAVINMGALCINISKPNRNSMRKYC